MSCGAGFGSPEGEPGEDGQEGHGAARTPRGVRAAEKPEWRHAFIRRCDGVWRRGSREGNPARSRAIALHNGLMAQIPSSVPSR